MAETKNKKVEEKIENTQIDGQMEIAPEDTAELKVVDETADTITAEMPDGEIVEIDKASIVTPEDIDEPMMVEDGVILAEDKCADHISRTKVLDVIKSTMAKYEGKVVLAMEEVRAIIKAITTAVEE